MRVFKFGGASVKDAEGVKNVAKVLQNQGFEACLLVVSAMGKTTNALEKVVDCCLKQEDFGTLISEIKDFHYFISIELFPEKHPIFTTINEFFEEMQDFLKRNQLPNYSFIYDQVVSVGEMISSEILSHYLNEIGFQNEFLDARQFIKTDSNYREGNVDWKKTTTNIRKINPNQCYVTQGFIGSNEDDFTTTLGREGSDYTAAIFAYALDAKEMTIWKDVLGVMSGDPRKFENVQLLEYISYEEAIEMAYYGASIIHPKTLQPLKQKKIPFYVKSFLEPKKQGTKIGESDKNKLYECFILKENQSLIQLSSKDFSFITEEHMSYLFGQLSLWKIKVTLVQNTAISLSLCVEDKHLHLQDFLQEIGQGFHSSFQTDLSLYTIRNSTIKTLLKYYKEHDVLLEQMYKNVYRILIKQS